VNHEVVVMPGPVDIQGEAEQAVWVSILNGDELVLHQPFDLELGQLIGTTTSQQITEAVWTGDGNERLSNYHAVADQTAAVAAPAATARNATNPGVSSGIGEPRGAVAPRGSAAYCHD
jgi:hypothetical protein